jgi:glycosyltransferase involved in cell wall biosynthesis
MRLLLLSSYLPDPVDGESTSARALVRGLRARGVQVTVGTTDRGWPPGEREKVRAEEVQLFHSLIARPLECAPGLLAFLLRKLQGFEVVHFRGVFSLGLLLGALLAHRRGRPYVISPMGNRIPFWRERQKISRGTGKYLFFKLLAQGALKGASRVVCASDREMARLRRQLGSGNLMWIPDGVEPSAYQRPQDRALLQARWGIGPGKKVFLFLGRLSPEKALEFLLEAWQGVAARRPEGILVITGGDDGHPGYAAELRGRVQALGLNGRVLWLGPVKDEGKVALLQHSVCLVLPSYHESFGIVVLEALAAGTPVLASQGTPWACLETLGLGRWLPWDRHLWAEAMLRAAAAGPDFKKEFAPRSRQWAAANFSWEVAADRYLRVYQEICRSQAA